MCDFYSLRIYPNIRPRRSTDSFVVPFCFYKKEIARKSISYLGSKIWSDLNQDIKASYLPTYLPTYIHTDRQTDTHTHIIHT